MPTHRVFIAVSIDPSPDLLQVIDELAQMGKPVRAVNPKQLHLTLRFLGKTEEHLLPRIAGAIRAAVSSQLSDAPTNPLSGSSEAARAPEAARAAEADRSAEQRRATIKPFDLHLCGLGAFPGISRARVVWAGIANPDPLITIVDRLNPLIDDLGFEREKRRYRPHLTLARVSGKPPAAIADLIARYKEIDLGRPHVASVDLMLSRLHPKGAIYEKFVAANLGGE